MLISMIAIGGYTRLSGSGLSMTDWNIQAGRSVRTGLGGCSGEELRRWPSGGRGALEDQQPNKSSSFHHHHTMDDHSRRLFAAPGRAPGQWAARQPGSQLASRPTQARLPGPQPPTERRVLAP